MKKERETKLFQDKQKEMVHMRYKEAADTKQLDHLIATKQYEQFA